jgi:hypothetical protein
LISRFVANTWFVESPVERRAYLSALGFELAHSDWRCFSYAVMSSHIHLALLAGNDRLRDWLRPAHKAFARWTNDRLSRAGAVFVRGPTLVAFRPEGVSSLVNYIHCNPVRANVVARPVDTDWTSHRAYMGLERRPHWLDTKLGLSLSGFPNGAALDEWMTEVRTQRDELELLRVTPARPRGRPPKSASSNENAQTSTQASPQTSSPRNPQTDRQTNAQATPRAANANDSGDARAKRAG